MMKLEQSDPPGGASYEGTDGRLTERNQTQTSTRRPTKDGGNASTAYGDRHGRSSTAVMCGHYTGAGQRSGQPCPAFGQFESTAGQWCNHAKHWHRTSSIHSPPEVVLRQDYSASGDRNYFYDVTGTESGDFATFVEWDATGNDVTALGRCHGDESAANEHVYEIAA